MKYTYILKFKSSFLYKIGFIISEFRKFFIFIFTKKFYFSKFPFYGDFYIENELGKWFINEPSDMHSIINPNSEKDLLKYFINTDKGIFLDIGANIGKYSIILGKKGFKCFLFEPNKLIYKYIRENIRLNNLANTCKLLEYGLSTKNEKLILKIPQGNNFGSGSVINRYTDCKKIEVKLVKFQNFIRENNLDLSKIRLIKIDVEGFEKEVIDSLLNFLQEINNIKIIVEIFDKGNVDYILKIMKNNNFKLIDKCDGDNYIFYKK